jgi:glutamate racemase
MRIGIFDSGVGGITVLHDALKMIPKADYLYYADTDNVPYGTKSNSEVRQFVLDAAGFLIGKPVDALVIACNTATSVAIDDLRRLYPIPIIGMEPAVKPAVQNNGSKRILVTATPLALKEEKLRNLILKFDNAHMVDLLSLPGLVSYAEGLEFDEKTVMPYLKEQLSGFDMDKYGTVVLGCTHYLYYKQVFRKLLPGHIHIIDGNMGTVRNLKTTIGERRFDMTGTGKITFYHSGREITEPGTAAKYLELISMYDQMQMRMEKEYPENRGSPAETGMAV